MIDYASIGQKVKQIRVKQRIRYYQKKYAIDHFDAEQYASVIEEYRLFTVLDIQPPVEK